MCRSPPPPSDFFMAGAKKFGSRDILPPLSKHPGAAPVHERSKKLLKMKNSTKISTTNGISMVLPWYYHGTTMELQ